MGWWWRKVGSVSVEYVFLAVRFVGGLILCVRHSVTNYSPWQLAWKYLVCVGIIPHAVQPKHALLNLHPTQRLADGMKGWGFGWFPTCGSSIYAISALSACLCFWFLQKQSQRFSSFSLPFIHGIFSALFSLSKSFLLSDFCLVMYLLWV